MFTKIGVTVATGALPVLLWAGAADAQSQQSQQSQVTVPQVGFAEADDDGIGGGLAATGAEDLLPLALGGAALAGAVVVRGIRRRSVS